MRILLIEDDTMIRESLCAALRSEGMTVDYLDRGEGVGSALKSFPYDLMLLDVGLPGRSGFDVLKQLRADGLDLPVLILTARDAIEDRVKGLDLGADDYLVKPFDIEELLARMRALARRRAGRSQNMMRVGALWLDPAAHAAGIGSDTISLSAREFTLLETLMSHPGMVFSRMQLEEKLYGWNEEIGSNTIEVYIHALRRKLGADLIRTVRGVGYSLNVDTSAGALT